MKTIKFRGRFIGEDGHDSYIGDKKVGDWIYGGYMRGDLNFVDGEGDFIVTGGGHAYRVDPETVAQLIGHDAEGKEIYEGDTVTDIENADYVVESSVLMFTPDRKSIYIGKTSTFNLVEEDEK